MALSRAQALHGKGGDGDMGGAVTPGSHSSVFSMKRTILTSVLPTTPLSFLQVMLR